MGILNNLFNFNSKKQTKSASISNLNQRPNMNPPPNFNKIEKKLENVSFNQTNSILKFDLIQYTYKRKIERYIQVNYERYPVYIPLITKKNVLAFNKKIDSIKFCQDLYKKFPDLNIDQKKYLCNVLKQNPEWLKLTDQIAQLEAEIKSLKQNYRWFEREKPILSLNKTHYKDKPSSIWIRILFTPLTLGLSWIGFMSKKRAQANAKLNAAIETENAIKKENYDAYCRDLKLAIEKNNLSINSSIDQKNYEIQIIHDKINNLDNLNYLKDNDGWFNLRKAFSFNKDELKNKKGIYIIWNQTKNKYYVGQTKDLYKRIFCNHFCNNDVKNIIFAKDWYNNDVFSFKWIECNTKDELDEQEMFYIDYYDSFNHGYNKTRGNK